MATPSTVSTSLNASIGYAASVRVAPPDSGVSVRIDPQQVSALTGSDYSWRYDGAAYQLIDIATGSAVPAAQMQVTTSGGTSTIKAHGLIVTAAVLQPPVLDMTQDAAGQYGSFGALVAHELGRSVDAKGRLVDAKGDVRTWWTPADDAAESDAPAEGDAPAGTEDTNADEAK